MSIKTNIRANEIIISQNNPSLGGGGNLEELLKSFSDKLSEIESAMAGIQKLKIGSIIMYSGADNDVEDFLLCDGAAYSRTNYADLFAVISTTFGDGDGSTTFNLPNLIDRFVEGSNTPGTVKEAGLPNVSYSFRITDNVMTNTPTSKVNITSGTAATASASTGNTATATTANVVAKSGNDTINVSLQNANPIYGNSTTVQPAALTLKYMIKYQ